MNHLFILRRSPFADGFFIPDVTVVMTAVATALMHYHGEQLVVRLLMSRWGVAIRRQVQIRRKVKVASFLAGAERTRRKENPISVTFSRF